MKIVVADAGDFFGVYVDGILKFQDNHIRWQDILNAISIPFEYMEVKQKAAHKIINQSEFPPTLSKSMIGS